MEVRTGTIWLHGRLRATGSIFSASSSGPGSIISGSRADGLQEGSIPACSISVDSSNHGDIFASRYGRTNRWPTWEHIPHRGEEAGASQETYCRRRKPGMSRTMWKEHPRWMHGLYGTTVKGN